MAAAVLQGMYYVSRGERDRGKVSDISLLFLSHAFSSLFPLYSVCVYVLSELQHPFSLHRHLNKAARVVFAETLFPSSYECKDTPCTFF